MTLYSVRNQLILNLFTGILYKDIRDCYIHQQVYIYLFFYTLAITKPPNF